MRKLQTYFSVALVALMFTRLAPAQETTTLPPGSGAKDTTERSAASEQDQETFPVSFDITYSLYSDYVFRGINFSEYPSEGREKPNHQLTTSLGLDLGMLFGEERGTYGTLGFDTFFEWYADQEILIPDAHGDHLQEVDYTVAWSYDIEPIASSFTLGYVFYTFPNVKPLNTHEWTVGLEHNDAWMWKWLFPDNEDGVLNPTFLFAHDVDEIRGSWAEIGVSHGFEVTKGLTITPSVLFAIDHRYLAAATGTRETGSTRLAYVQYGLSADFDLSTLGRIPKDPGTWTLSGFLYFNDAMGSAENRGAIDDELFGGMSLSWSF